MSEMVKSRPRRRWQPMRRVALSLTGIGVTSEMVAIVGMIFGILAGFSFMSTAEALNPRLFWALGLVFCLLRIACIRIDGILHFQTSKRPLEEVFFTELPERVSDAVTLIGFGFAANSSPWLGLSAALAAIFSAYVRSIGEERGAGKKRAASGPMTRIHRLILISATSVLMLIEIPTSHFTTPIPQIALWVILFGCILTILIRWSRIRRMGTG